MLSHSPGRGEELGIGEPIEIVFDQAMNPSSVEAATHLDPSLPVAFDWADDRTLRVLPMETWARATTYEVRIGGGATNAAGETIDDPIRVSLTTVGYLEATQVIPADGTDEVAVDSVILAIFNRPVVPLMALSDPASADLPSPLRFEPSIAGAGEWINTSIYQFTPSEPLRGGTIYTATVLAGLTDTTGGVVEQNIEWQFTTERPRIVWRSPEHKDDLVPIDSQIRVTFNMPMSLVSAVEHVHLRTTSLLGEAFATVVSGTYEVESNDIVFTPEAPLDFDTTYLIEIEAGLAAEHGGLGLAEPSSWRFDTVPLPEIVGTTPSDGQQSANPYTSLVIRFNTPIDPDTVLEHLAIEPTPEPSEIDGYFRAWDNSYIVRFGAQPSTDYVVLIRPGIADPYGNTIDQSLSIRFRTSPLDPTAWLHVPSDVGTFSAYESARIFVAYRNTDRLTVTLNRLSLTDYFEGLYRWFMYDFSPAPGSVLRRWAVSLTSELNELTYAPLDLTEDGSPLEPGIYMVCVEADGVERNAWQHQHVLVVSPINLTFKTSDDETLVWATDLETGNPVPGLILRAYDGQGAYMSASVTDRDGLVTLPGADETDWRGLAVVGNFPFVLGSSEWDDGISAWEFGLPHGSRTEWRIHLDTDRPIYRPIQTVSFRGIFREESDAAYRLPTAESVKVQIWDAAWNLIYDTSLPLDAFGTYSDVFPLGEDATLGTYRIETHVAGSYATHTFEVAEYRAPEFEVVVVPETDEIASDESIKASIELTYFFGGGVARQDVTWRVFSDEYRYSPSQFGEYTFTDNDDPWYGWRWWWDESETLSPILEQTGRTDASGRLTIEIPADLAEDDPDAFIGGRTLTIEATATGSDGQTISGRCEVIVHPASFYAGLASSRTVAHAGDESELDVVSVTWDGERLPQIQLTYTIHRREWANVYEEDEAGGGRWTWTTNDIEIEDGTLETGADGSAVLRFVPPEGGTYKVSVSGTDSEGRLARSSLFIWASGPDTVSWRRSNDDRITLISDKTAYEVGETAEILIPSPYAGEQWALITVERAGVLWRDVVKLESNSDVYRLPITEENIPNIFVGVVIVQGREDARALADGSSGVAEMKVGYVSFDVSRAPRLLTIDLQPSDSAPLPGDTIAYDLHVTDADGRPVQASLSFDLVDKAVLSLQPRQTNAIAETFFGPRYLSVSTASGLTISVNRLVVEQLEDYEEIATNRVSYDLDDATVGAALPMAAEGISLEMAEPSDKDLPEGVSVREDFQDTAYWQPRVVTDKNGRASVAFDLPDNVTTWVARSVGVTTDTDVGEGLSELLVTKPLLVRPVAPRFFVVGDRVRLAAGVSNQTDGDLAVDVTLAQTGLTLEDPPIQQILVPARGETTVTWWCQVSDVSSVDLAFSAVSGGLSDAARPRLTRADGTLPVYRYTAPETVGTAGQLDSAGSRTELILLPANADLDRSELLLRIETSLAAAMQQGLDYLEHFEYECTEQVVSRFLPNVLTQRALRRLGIDNPDLAERLPKLVDEGIEKLRTRQNSDGGWGWWEYDESNTTLTAYAVLALVHARASDFVVEGDMLARGLEYLDQSLVEIDDLTSSWMANRQAWVLYVLALAGRGEDIDADVAALYEERAKLSHYARAYLAMTIHLADAADERVDTLVSDLINAAILSATGAHWEEPDYDWWAMNTDTRSTAIILDALVQIDPTQALLPNVVRWLMVARTGGIWETTQETAWALIALTDWMDATGELAGSYDFSASLDDDLLLSESVSGTAGRLPDPVTIEIGADHLATDRANELTIARGNGPGRLYYTAHLDVQLPVEQVEAMSRGIIVQRQYIAVDCTSDAGCKSLASAIVGDTILVRLTIIAPNDLYYVVVEDPYPAGCEAVDTTLATSSLADPEAGLSRQTENSAWNWFYRWWWRWFSRSEMRDEKLVLFADYLSAGTYTYEYALRATTPGEFRVLPTSAHEFYFPEVFGRTDGELFVVEAGD